MPIRMPCPPPQPGALSPSAAAFVAARCRKLLRAGKLTPHDIVVADSLLWSSRERGSDLATSTYSRMQQLAHVGRATVAKAIKRLIALGIVEKIKQRALRLWKNGGSQWQQRPNIYRFIQQHCEFTPRTERIAKQEISFSSTRAPALDADQADFVRDMREKGSRERAVRADVMRQAAAVGITDQRVINIWVANALA